MVGEEILASELVNQYEEFLVRQKINKRYYIQPAKAFLRKQVGGNLVGDVIKEFRVGGSRFLQPFFKFLEEDLLLEKVLANDMAKLVKPRLKVVNLFFELHPDIPSNSSIVHLVNSSLYTLKEIEFNPIRHRLELFLKAHDARGRNGYRAKILVQFLMWMNSDRSECRSWVKKNLKYLKLEDIITKLNGSGVTSPTKSLPSKIELRLMVDYQPTIELKVLVALRVMEGLSDRDLMWLRVRDCKGNKHGVCNELVDPETGELLTKLTEGMRVPEVLVFPKLTTRELVRAIRSGLDHIGKTDLLVKEFLAQLKKVNHYKAVRSEPGELVQVQAPTEIKKSANRRPNLGLRAKLKLD